MEKIRYAGINAIVSAQGKRIQVRDAYNSYVEEKKSTN
jgi:hypothetical protein|tara:strand:+ start:993 stop:1106 length:114 start_codon:yes stop_codon:yes gene_type:complete